MSQISGWKRKLILLFRSEKRLGASRIMSSYFTKSFDQMKQTIITESDVDLDNIPEKVRIKDLSGHLNKVKKEFIGQPEICFYHATLIILLRRKFKTDETFKEFKHLWETESNFLLNSLNIRWIVSACDTFVDHDSNAIRACLLMNVVTMVNTLKAYEAQRFLFYPTPLDKEHINKTNLDRLYEKDLNLYGGLTYFRLGSDDTLNNMRQRFNKLSSYDELGSHILMTVFERLQYEPTAFETLKKLHTDHKSKWW